MGVVTDKDTQFRDANAALVVSGLTAATTQNNAKQRLHAISDMHYPQKKALHDQDQAEQVAQKYHLAAYREWRCSASDA